MPPPQNLLASTIRGFVCRSCRTKLQTSLRVPLGVRGMSRRNRAARQNGKKQTPDLGSAVKFYEEDQSGRRTELADDAEDAEGFRQLVEEMGLDPDEVMKDDEGPNDIVHDPDDTSNMLEAHKDPAVIQRIHKKWLEAQTKPPGTPGSMEDLEARMQKLQRVLEGLVGSTPNSSPETPASSPFTIHPPLPPPAAAKPTPKPAKLVRNLVARVGEHKAHEVPVTLFPKQAHIHLIELNVTLTEALSGRPVRLDKKGSKRVGKKRLGSSGDRIKRTWRAYVMSRSALVSSATLVHDLTWSTLWNELSKDSVENLDRMAHVKVLGRDMQKAGVAMTEAQQLLYIEAVFIEGDRELAVEEWQSMQKNKTLKSNTYWETGVRIFGELGHPREALHAAENLLADNMELENYRILLPIMKAFLNSKAESSIQQAWALYIRMRVNMKEQMTMSDYDTVISMFMAVNKPDLALGIFRDMMTTDSKTTPDSTARWIEATASSADLRYLRFDDRELTWQDFKGVSVLPPELNNRFFFGSWIKKLIGDNDLVAAKQVFDLMMERRIRPDAIQMNGLIGAWYREGSETNRAFAEEMAWRMIKCRIESVNRRDHRETKLESPVRPILSNDATGVESLQLYYTPYATIETFTILLQQYRRRQRSDVFEDLFSALRQAQIRPSTAYMNELLMVDLKTHKTSWARDTYLDLTRRGVRPDFETYEILWDFMKRRLELVSRQGMKIDKKANALMTPQTLFAEMVPRIAEMVRKAKEPFPRELYESIILTFSFAENQIGSAVALRALQRYANLYPTEDTTRVLILQLARLGMLNDWGYKPRRLKLHEAATQERIANVTQLLATFKQQRTDALLEQGIRWEDLNGTAKSEQALTLLTDLLKFVAQQIQKTTDDSVGTASDVVKAAEREAARMGVPDCNPWMAHDGGMV